MKYRKILSFSASKIKNHQFAPLVVPATGIEKT